MENLLTIKNVKGYLDDNGMAHLNLEDVARGLGFVQTKNNVEYVRWETVYGYLRDFGFSQQVGKDSFIPENIFYKLCFKAQNEVARRFQDVVTDEVLPSIRKHGMYATDATIDKILANPDFGIALLQNLKEERAINEALRTENSQKDQLIGELQPKADYVDHILSSTDTMTIRQIAADYGLTANKLNQLLHGERVQYKTGKQWLLYAMYLSNGYTKSETYALPHLHEDGAPKTALHTKWTQKGRLFINELLNKNNIFADVVAPNRQVAL